MIITPSDMIQSRKVFDTWDDLRFPATAVGVGANAPPWNTAHVGWNFQPNPPNNQEIQAVAQMPHRWREGSTIHVHIHWYLAVAGAVGEDVKWDILYRVASPGGTFPVGWTTNQALVDVSGYGVREHVYTDLGDIAMGGMMGAETISVIIDLRLQRDTQDAADDHNQGVIFKELDLHYQADSFGSYDEWAKWG